MNDELLIEAAKQGDSEKVKALIESGANVNVHGNEQEWTPLNYAAGKGDLAVVKLLVEDGGADIALTGLDNRTPYSIALAADQGSVARYLASVERRASNNQNITNNLARGKMPYCKAYRLGDLREFADWAEETNLKAEREVLDDDVVFIHQDLTVTQSMFHNENVIMDEVSSEWQAFCHEVLSFTVPDDFDLMSSDRSVDIKEDDGTLQLS